MRFFGRLARFAQLPASASGRKTSFMDALSVQLRVVSALMLRGALVRFGHENLGFFWVMAEPLLMAVGVMVMWSIAGMDHGHGVGLIPFVLTGYTMLTLWRHLVGHSISVMSHNVGLMFHRSVKMVDILLAGVLLESLGGLAAFTIAYIPLYLINVVPMIQDPLLLVGGWVVITWLGLGFGMIIAGLSEFSGAIARFIPPIMYVTLPATGAFYLLEWLPIKAQKILYWSPLVQPFEMFRAGLFGNAISTKFDFFYMTIVCTIMTAAGLGLLRVAQRRVHSH